MPGNNTVKGDRMGACWSIEGRAPFLDHRVSEMFARLPITSKYSVTASASASSSRPPRSYYDHDFVFRPKTMPTLPIGEWIKGPAVSSGRVTC
jgi:asparagine synthase (glutamine-hydrolysing)